MCEKGELESMMCQWTSDFEADSAASNMRPKYVKVSRQSVRPRKTRPRSQTEVGPAAIRDLGPEGKARIAALIRELASVSQQRSEFESKLAAAESEKNALIARRKELEAELEAAKAEQQKQTSRIFTEKIDAELLLRSLKEENEKNSATRQCRRCDPAGEECPRCEGGRQECRRCNVDRQESSRSNSAPCGCRRCEPAQQECRRCNPARQDFSGCDALRQERCGPVRQKCDRSAVTSREECCSYAVEKDVTREAKTQFETSGLFADQQETFCRPEKYREPRAPVTSPRSHLTSTPRTATPARLESERDLLERERELLEREKRCLEAELAARMRLQAPEKPWPLRCEPVRAQSPHSLHSFVLRPGVLNAGPPDLHAEAASDDASLGESVTLALADTEAETVATSPRPRDRYLRRPGRQPPSPPSSLLDVIDSMSVGSPRGFNDEEHVDEDENRLLEDLFFVRLL